jgi:ribosome-binding protein aMBF1 (putative translation factor)
MSSHRIAFCLPSRSLKKYESGAIAKEKRVKKKRYRILEIGLVQKMAGRDMLLLR